MARGARVRVRSVFIGEWWVLRGWGGVGGATSPAWGLEPNQGERECPRGRGILVGEVGYGVVEPDRAEEGMYVAWTEDSSGLVRDLKAKAG